LTITPEAAHLEATTDLGVLRGLETFLQLVTNGPNGFAAPAVTIEDQPRFPWRGLSYDVARNFMPVDVIKRNLDGIAAVKMNVFHWHLTDDQGFRLELKKHPELTVVGGTDGFYTQDDVREIVAYAKKRGRSCE
jgi:hexosaminidase